MTRPATVVVRGSRMAGVGASQGQLLVHQPSAAGPGPAPARRPGRRRSTRHLVVLTTAARPWATPRAKAATSCPLLPRRSPLAARSLTGGHTAIRHHGDGTSLRTIRLRELGGSTTSLTHSRPRGGVRQTHSQRSTPQRVSAGHDPVLTMCSTSLSASPMGTVSWSGYASCCPLARTNP